MDSNPFSTEYVAPSAEQSVTDLWAAPDTVTTQEPKRIIDSEQWDVVDQENDIWFWWGCIMVAGFFALVVARWLTK